MCAICLSILLELVPVRQFEEFGLREYTWNEVVILVLRCQIAGFIIAAYLFYLVLHAVQNLFAELTRFGDRQFYGVR